MEAEIKETEKIPTQEDMRLLEMEYVKKTNELGTWDDIQKLRVDLKEMTVYAFGKYWVVKFKDLGWGARNQITEELALSMGNNPNPMMYERAMQEAVIKRRVVTIGDHNMQPDNGGPLTVKEWHGLPATLGEAIRLGFFGNTGETCNKVASGAGFETIEQVQSFIKRLVNAKNENPDGKQTQEDSLLKK